MLRKFYSIIIDLFRCCHFFKNIRTRVLKFLNKHSILYEYQFEFWQNHSTTICDSGCLDRITHRPTPEPLALQTRKLCSVGLLCETQWPWRPLFSPSWLIQWSMGEEVYITLFSSSDVTAFHRMKYWGGGVITLFSPNDVTAFPRIIYKTKKQTHM